MNREEFKLRMKSLKSYRELNPDKGYWDWKVELFDKGGEVLPDNSPARVNPITGKPLASGTLEPAITAEDIVSFTPLGDIMSIGDAFVAARNKDLLGLGLAGLGLIPFVPRLGRARAAKRTLDSPTIPTVDRDHFLKRFEEMERRDAKKSLTANDFYRQRNDVYESLIENEDAFRRAASADANYGTNYRRVYEEYIKEYGRDPSSYNDELVLMRLTDDIPKEAKAQVNPRNLGWINVNDRYVNINEVDPVFQQMNPGLVRHEISHITDEKAGLDYVRSLANPNKFEPESKLKEMYPKNYRMIQDYLLNGSEIKSHMNEFRDFLFNKGLYQPNETVKSMRLKLDLYKDQFKGLNILFDVYKNKRQFVKDFNAVPITATEQNNNLV